MVREVSQIKSMPDWKKIEQGDTAAIRAKFDELSKGPIRRSLLEERAGCARTVCAGLLMMGGQRALNICIR